MPSQGPNVALTKQHIMLSNSTTSTGLSHSQLGRPKTQPHDINQHHYLSQHAPGVQSILSDYLTRFSLEYWASTDRPLKPFSSKIVDDIYNKELSKANNTPRIMLLELSMYLENFLWPNYDPAKSTSSHIISIMMMVNEKCRENMMPWDCFQTEPTRFISLFRQLLDLVERPDLTYYERNVQTLFLINVFQSLSHSLVQNIALRLVSLPLWISLSEEQRNTYFHENPRIDRTWKKVQKMHNRVLLDAKEEAFCLAKRNIFPLSACCATTIGASIPIQYERFYILQTIEQYFEILESINPDASNMSTLSSSNAALSQNEIGNDMAEHAPTLSVAKSRDDNLSAIHYCERFVELLIDLLSQLPTRRFFHPLFRLLHVVIRSKQSSLHSMPDGILFKQLVSVLQFYDGFEINDFTGQALTDAEMISQHYATIHQAQMIAWRYFQPELQEFSLTNVNSINNREAICQYFGSLDYSISLEFCKKLNLIANTSTLSPLDADSTSTLIKKKTSSNEFLLNILCEAFEHRQSQLDSINHQSLCPDEFLLWDDSVIAMNFVEGTLAIPKLNLQFLTFHDYLLRNFTLFRLESTYEIRQDIEDAVSRMKPRLTAAGSTVMRGWARMALPVTAFSWKHISKPKIGDLFPESVTGQVTYWLPSKGDKIQIEWDSLKVHDIVFLVVLKARIPDSALAKSDSSRPGKHFSSTQEDSEDQRLMNFPTQYGIVAIRGAEVISLADEQGRVLTDPFGDDELKGTATPSLDSRKSTPSATKPNRNSGSNLMRTITLAFDPCQYYKDEMDRLESQDSKDLYSNVNMIIRRNSKENNFKAVLESIRNLMNTKFAVPQWLTQVLLGYGNPAMSTNVERANEIDFVDTFLDFEHLKQSFPKKTIQLSPHYLSQSMKESMETQIDDEDKSKKCEAPPLLYKIHFEVNKDSPENEILIVEPYTFVKKPHWKSNPSEIQCNRIRFTPTQVEAIQSTMNKGLTMVVGPPGTGKTDVAVQILNNWYWNFPYQRTLLVTHSNNALNQIFEKIMELNIDEKHLLRLGHGGEMLNTEKDFGKQGRVDYMLARRLELLDKVQELAMSIKHPTTDVSYSVETAFNFFTTTVRAKWEKFNIELSSKPCQSTAELIERFPFHDFSSSLPKINASLTIEEATSQIKATWQEIEAIFDLLNECRPFELLRSSYDRSNYLLTKQAKIIAMTCTHAALKRSDLVKLGFKFDNILMEEAAQILEIETFIPILLQDQEPGTSSRLKRIVLIGDHNQLPPVVKNAAIQKIAHFDQSLFTRFIRLGVPHFTLDVQGRSRPSIASLYNWKYKKMDNLDHVITRHEFQLANPGFVYDYQLIDVPDYQGVGELEPTPHFFQNLGEAEYVVATYMYMRLLGYPACKISIITSYNGQKHLIRDVIRQRCAWDPKFGQPAKITTVDRFQGQQNDYILLSLVRTKTVGHIRDARRLVVAMSRARLGLYIFARVDLFKDCYEITPTFSRLLKRPTKLVLVQNETYDGMIRKNNQEPSENDQFLIQDVIHMGQVVLPIQVHPTNSADQESEPMQESSDITPDSKTKDSSISSDAMVE